MAPPTLESGWGELGTPVLPAVWGCGDPGTIAWGCGEPGTRGVPTRGCGEPGTTGDRGIVCRPAECGELVMIACGDVVPMLR